MNIKFYDKILEIKNIKTEEVHSFGYLHMAEIDYLTAKQLYGDILLFPSFLNHVQQAIEKYSCFIQEIFFQKKIKKSHKIEQFRFLDNIPRDEFDVIKSLFENFSNNIRYLSSNGYAYNIVAVGDILDKFVYNVRLLLYESNAIDKLKEITHIHIQRYCVDNGIKKPILPYIIPLLYSSNMQNNQNIYKKMERYKSLVEKENKQIRLLKNIFNKK